MLEVKDGVVKCDGESIWPGYWMEYEAEPGKWVKVVLIAEREGWLEYAVIAHEVPWYRQAWIADEALRFRPAREVRCGAGR